MSAFFHLPKDMRKKLSRSNARTFQPPKLVSINKLFTSIKQLADWFYRHRGLRLVTANEILITARFIQELLLPGIFSSD